MARVTGPNCAVMYQVQFYRSNTHAYTRHLGPPPTKHGLLCGRGIVERKSATIRLKVTCAACAITSRRVGTQHTYSYAHKTNTHSREKAEAGGNCEGTSKVRPVNTTTARPYEAHHGLQRGSSFFCSTWTPRVLQVNTGFCAHRGYC